jgi:UDP-4-amino-4,6-dideoxy-N-acetyl-beta-L-altrosamine transaminase
MMKPIPYGKQTITKDDINAVIDTLQSDFLTQGPKIAEFEKAFAEYIGCKYALAVANGTAALHLSALALNVKEGDQVITTPITFAASANCIRYCGGEVLFADIDANSYLIDLFKVEELLKKDKEKRIKGIIPVDFAGNPVDLQKLKAIADKYKCWIIEDACHAPGGFFGDSSGKQQLCGNGEFADLSIFSFHPVKHIATAEGGMITTNNKMLYDKLVLLRTHGISKDANLMTENHGGWYYQMLELGYNYRLTDMQAALGTSQLKRAAEGLERRKVIAKKYDEAFRAIPDKLTTPKYDNGHAFHLYVVKARNEKRQALYEHLRSNNIFAQVHYIPVHTMPYYQNLGYRKGDFPVSENYYNECLSLPMYPGLTDQEQNFVIETILNFYK